MRRAMMTAGHHIVAATGLRRTAGEGQCEHRADRELKAHGRRLPVRLKQNANARNRSQTGLTAACFVCRGERNLTANLLERFPALNRHRYWGGMLAAHR